MKPKKKAKKSYPDMMAEKHMMKKVLKRRTLINKMK